MSAVWLAARGAVRRRRLQTAVIGLVVFVSAVTIVIALSELAAAANPFGSAFAAQNGAHLVAAFDSAQVSVTRLEQTARQPGVTAAAGPFAEATVIAGARAGKDSRIAAPIVVYEAVFGGHERHLARGERAVIPLVAQDQRATDEDEAAHRDHDPGEQDAATDERDADADADHRRDQRRHRRHVGHTGHHGDEPEADEDAEDGGPDRDTGGDHRPEGDEQHDHGDREADRFPALDLLDPAHHFAALEAGGARRGHRLAG